MEQRILRFKDGTTKKVVYVNKDRKIHRDDDAPALIEYFSDGRLKKEEYYSNGKKHRLNKPASIKYRKNGSLLHKMYFLNGKKHSFGDVSASTHYFSNGNPISESFCKNGKYHRENGPAYIHYYENGTHRLNTYHMEGKKHRENDLPAEISFFENGEIQAIRFYIKDIHKRINSEKAVNISFHRNGEVNYKIYTNSKGKQTSSDPFRKPYYEQFDVNGNKIEEGCFYDVLGNDFKNGSYLKFLKSLSIETRPIDLTDDEIEFIKMALY